MIKMIVASGESSSGTRFAIHVSDQVQCFMFYNCFGAIYFIDVLFE